MITHNLTAQDIRQWLQDGKTIMKILEDIQLEKSLDEPLSAAEVEDSGDVRFTRETLFVGKTAVPLQTRPLNSKLVRSFFQKNDQFLTKEELVEYVYGVKACASSRLFESKSLALTKLISRTRYYLNRALAHQKSSYDGIEWFPHCPQRKGYELYRITLPGKVLSAGSEIDLSQGFQRSKIGKSDESPKDSTDA